MTLSIGNGFLNYFYSRYLAGGSTLGEARRISRRNLALAEVVQAPQYAHAIVLKEQIERFEKAVKLVKESKELSIELLCDINKTLTPEERRSGEVRSVQNWLGKSLETAYYLPPPPTELDSLLCKFINLINNSTLPTKEKALLAYVNTQKIHTFADGNGRTARAIYAGILAKEYDIHIPLSLYRLKVSPDYYYDFLRVQPINSEGIVSHDYLGEAYQWINNYEKEVAQQLIATQKCISNKIGFSYMTAEDMDIVTLLWRYPVLTYETIKSHLNNNQKKAHDVISTLSNCSILSARKISYQTKTIYVAEDIFNCWDKLDNLMSDIK